MTETGATAEGYASDDDAVPEYVFVQREQCSGRDMTCVNCGKALGDRHDVLCYTFAILASRASRQAHSSELEDRS